jgi:hypothetical protein
MLQRSGGRLTMMSMCIMSVTDLSSITIVLFLLMVVEEGIEVVDGVLFYSDK